MTIASIDVESRSDGRNHLAFNSTGLKTDNMTGAIKGTKICARTRVRTGLIAGSIAVFVALLAVFLAMAFMPSVVLADNYEGGQLLSTVQSGIVSGGVYVDASPPVFAYEEYLNQTKTFTLPAAAVAEPGRIAWARLYVSVYVGHMQNNYVTRANVSLDGDGDGSFETALDPLLLSEDVPFVYIKNGGNPPGGQAWASVDDHTTRVSSDYLMWYDVTGLLTGQHPSVHVDTRGSFDGRIKVITLVVAYNDGDEDQYYYWVNQGHDVDSYYLDYPDIAPLSWNDYIGSTTFTGIPTGITNPALTVNHMASSDGLYTFAGSGLTRYDTTGGNSSVQDTYSGYDVWNLNGYITGDTAALTYDRSAMGGSGEYSGQYYKIPLTTLTVQLPAGVPGANFSADRTEGLAPLTVQFHDESTGPAIGWAWDLDGDGITDSTAKDPVYTYHSPGIYTVSLTATGPGGNNSKTRTGYITVISTVPAAAFTVNRTAGVAPLTIAFTDQSAGSIDSWAWDFNNDGTNDSTAQHPVYTFNASGTYSVRLTVSGPYGSDTLIKPGLVTASASAQYDLAVTGVSAGFVIALQNNSIGITMKNNGPDAAPASVVELRASDGFTGRAAVPALAGGSSATVYVADETIRPLEGVTVSYTAVADPDNVLPETNETNNSAASVSYNVVYNGYEGKRYWAGGSDITTKRTYDLRGGIAYSQGDSIYHSGVFNHTVTWTGSQPAIPAGASIIEAYVYASWNWDNMRLFPDKFSMTFNGQPIPYINAYTDQSNFGGYGGHRYGLATYDVTALYLPNGVNTMSVERLDGRTSAIATFPFTLFVVYQDSNASRKQIFINEEYDLLAPGYGGNPDQIIAYAPFSGMAIDTGNVTGAILYSFATHAGPAEGNLFFNNDALAIGAYHGDSQTSGAGVFNVTGLLTPSGNVVAIQGTSSGGMGAIQQVLVVESRLVPPVVNFSANMTSGIAPLAVAFDTYDSTGLITAWAWDFDGDGITDSTERNPVFTFRTMGTFTVSVSASGPGGNGSMVRHDYITTNYAAPAAAFTAAPTSGEVPLAVAFDAGASTGSIYSYLWSFGDGNTSNLRNPSHTYFLPGNYSVSLTVDGPAGSDTSTKAGYILIDYAVPVAVFTGTPTAGMAPLTVQFSDASSGSITSWAWDFDGDGVTDSTERNPSWTYNDVGVYTVSLTVSGPRGNNSVTKAGYISSNVGQPTAGFEANVTAGLVPLCVHFTDTSVNATSWAWDFNNDGITDSTAQNPVYTYMLGGNYSVRLTVTGPSGSDSMVKSGYVNAIGIVTRQWPIYYNPHGIAMDGQDNLFVADTGNNLVRKVFPDGTSVTIGSGFQRPLSIAVDGQGNVYVKESGRTRVIYPNGSGAIFDSSYVMPSSEVVDGEGNVYTRSDVNVIKTSPDGSSTLIYRGWATIDCIAVDSSGNLYIIPNTGELLERFVNGSVSLFGYGFRHIPGDITVSDVAYDDQSNLYVYSPGTDGGVTHVFFRNGSVAAISGKCDVPWHRAIDGQGDRFVADTNNNSVVEIFPNGSVATIGYNFASPRTLAVDSRGHVCVVDSNAITELAVPGYVPVPPAAAFDVSPAVGIAPLAVAFTDLSAGHVDAWAWDFDGDGVTDSTTQNPVYTYLVPGTYAVSLTATGPGGSDTKVGTGCVVVGHPVPAARFSGTPLVGVVPMTVQFDSGASSGAITSYAWSFGDGNTSTTANPSHTYVTKGIYTVSLTVTSPGGSNATVKNGYITCGDSFAVSLSPGWNLISVPLNNTGLHASDLVNNASMGVSMVSWYSPSTGFHSYYTGAKPGADFILAPDIGYFVRAARSSGFSVYGTEVPAHDISLYQGWNLIGWSSFASARASDILARANVSMVSSYNPLSGYQSYYQGAKPGANFTLTAGSGYFLNSKDASVQQLYVG